MLATPGSYNTSMGNVRVIREQLKPEHEVFISEMGARKRLDIDEICQFVKPQIGLITSIGPQHLETFKKIENVQKTKGELLNGVVQEGSVFLPKDNSYCFDLYKKEEKHTKVLYSLAKDKKGEAFLYAKDIKISKEGSCFTVVIAKEIPLNAFYVQEVLASTKEAENQQLEKASTQMPKAKKAEKGVEEFVCTTKLLGEHNVENILGCIAIAKSLGLTNEQIQAGIQKIEPVEHRLQLLPTNNGTTVIDDAFNSNPVGSRKALDVLKQFDGRKIIITPGMVELGKEEYAYNKEFGKQMADVVDIAILVGAKRSTPIVEGLKEKHFDDMAIYVVNSLAEATAKLGTLVRQGDVILFENDLPDNYDEK